MYNERKLLYAQIETARNSKVLTYVTGTRQNLETQIHTEVLDFFTDHLDSMFGECRKITLILHSNGGVTLAGWAIVNLIRMFCDEFEVIVPSKALSTGTLIAIGADKIIMTKQATLGPIDPSTNGPFNPQFPIDGSGQTLPVSVEHVAGYFDLAHEQLGRKCDLNKIFLKLSDKVHPLAIGNVQRARNQIKMLARRMLKYHMTDEARINKVIDFLCSESGSHDYTINRREAQEIHGLPIEKPTPALYAIIKDIYKDISNELEFTTTFNPNIQLGTEATGEYSLTRALVESTTGGSHRFMSNGKLFRTTAPQPIGGAMVPIEQTIDQRTFEGWTYEAPN